MSSIGNRFKYLRKHLQMTQKELSKAVGISQGTLSDIEKDNCYPATETLLSVFRYIDISADWLLKGTGLAPGETTSQQLEQQPSPISTDPILDEWLTLFYAVPPDARPFMIGTVKTIIQNTAPSSANNNNPSQAPSTSTTTANDEHAATRSEIA